VTFATQLHGAVRWAA